jgi:hypothetical protein
MQGMMTGCFLQTFKEDATREAASRAAALKAEQDKAAADALMKALKAGKQ